MKCEIEGRIVNERGDMLGSARVEYWCKTHGVPAYGYSEHIPGGSDVCPVGKIEAATEAGLARIKAAVETPQ